MTATAAVAGLAAGRGFAVSAGLDPGLAAELAARCEELGYGSLWSNDHAAVGPPSGDGLATLAALAAGSDKLLLGIGALALDRHSPAQIAAAIERSQLDPARLLLAISCGRADDPLELTGAAAAELRELLGATPLLLAAVGPRMCELAGAIFDGLLVAWMTPPLIAAAREQAAAGARRAGREPPPVAGYVRTAVGADAETRLARDEGFFRALGGPWRAHFARLSADPGRTGVFADYRDEIPAGLAPYEEALDLLIVRGLAAARLPMLDRIVTAAAPAADDRPGTTSTQAGSASGSDAGGPASSSVNRETTAPKAK